MLRLCAILKVQHEAVDMPAAVVINGIGEEADDEYNTIYIVSSSSSSS